MSKAVLVTGGSRGIGRATALLAARHGWAVAVNYASNAAAAERTVGEIEAAGGQAVAVRGDVSNEQDVIAMFDATVAAFGRVGALVNNAGVSAPRSAVAAMPIERIRRTFEVNVLGAFLCAREAARRMSKSAGGTGGGIVNVSSVAARLGSPGVRVDYATSKGALDTMTIGLAQELGPEGIRVNAVRPGVIDTEIHATSGDPERARMLGQATPLGRIGRAEEVAEAIVWLLSDAASYTSGAVIDVSGAR
jgi:NAD(P)-dependent dehydrogenase (short-subunit alcohol dehydrogenase family)